MDKTKVVIIPGAFQYVKNYNGYNGVDIWLKSFPNELPVADYYIGHSGGVNFILTHYDSTQKGKFIFINPQIRKRNFLVLLVGWVEFFFLEGIKWKKITPISSWPFGIKRLLGLLKVDVFGIMLKMPQKDLIVVRGKNDNYFCDKESVKILKNNNFIVIEVEAGHDWNENIAETVNKIINNI